MEDGFHGFYASFIKRGQTIEQDICMAELDPDNNRQFSVKVWSNPQSEEYQENIRFGRYIETHCPYCGSDKVEEVDSPSRTRYGAPEEIKYLCHNCEKDFLFDTERETYATRNRIPLTPNGGVAKR